MWLCKWHFTCTGVCAVHICRHHTHTHRHTYMSHLYGQSNGLSGVASPLCACVCVSYQNVPQQHLIFPWDQCRPYLTEEPSHCFPLKSNKGPALKLGFYHFRMNYHQRFCTKHSLTSVKNLFTNTCIHWQTLRCIAQTQPVLLKSEFDLSVSVWVSSGGSAFFLRSKQVWVI